MKTRTLATLLLISILLTTAPGCALFSHYDGERLSEAEVDAAVRAENARREALFGLGAEGYDYVEADLYEDCMWYDQVKTLTGTATLLLGGTTAASGAVVLSQENVESFDFATSAGVASAVGLIVTYLVSNHHDQLFTRNNCEAFGRFGR